MEEVTPIDELILRIRKYFRQETYILFNIELINKLKKFKL
jgi:hypothetical protein